MTKEKAAMTKSEMPASHLMCPILTSPDEQRITLAHGEGGRLMRQLIRERIIPVLGGKEALLSMDDAAPPDKGASASRDHDRQLRRLASVFPWW